MENSPNLPWQSERLDRLSTGTQRDYDQWGVQRACRAQLALHQVDFIQRESAFDEGVVGGHGNTPADTFDLGVCRLLADATQCKVRPEPLVRLETEGA